MCGHKFYFFIVCVCKQKRRQSWMLKWHFQSRRSVTGTTTKVLRSPRALTLLTTNYRWAAFLRIYTDTKVMGIVTSLTVFLNFFIVWTCLCLCNRQCWRFRAKRGCTDHLHCQASVAKQFELLSCYLLQVSNYQKEQKMDMAAQKKLFAQGCFLLCWIADPYNQICFWVTVWLEFVCLIYIQCWKW